MVSFEILANRSEGIVIAGLPERSLVIIISNKLEKQFSYRIVKAERPENVPSVILVILFAATLLSNIKLEYMNFSYQ